MQIIHSPAHKFPQRNLRPFYLQAKFPTFKSLFAFRPDFVPTALCSSVKNERPQRWKERLLIVWSCCRLYTEYVAEYEPRIELFLFIQGETEYVAVAIKWRGSKNRLEANEVRKFSTSSTWFWNHNSSKFIL